ncbi:hypothetical protein E1301_Tti014356 [Triplophysa tibetana]|uniref:Uncharacterized protein n=1 Tax=Triplophysa tibetana TaxID=1572043 RepID=A0A5A9NDJ0_9TELE|nr:hypothetical protein E1301_Tti014356 [Triplophysa tibetana]
MLPDVGEHLLDDLVNFVLQAMGSEFRVGGTDGDLSDRHPVPVKSGGSVSTHPMVAQHSSKTPHRFRNGSVKTQGFCVADDDL